MGTLDQSAAGSGPVNVSSAHSGGRQAESRCAPAVPDRHGNQSIGTTSPAVGAADDERVLPPPQYVTGAAAKQRSTPTLSRTRVEAGRGRRIPQDFAAISAGAPHDDLVGAGRADPARPWPPCPAFPTGHGFSPASFVRNKLDQGSPSTPPAAYGTITRSQPGRTRHSRFPCAMRCLTRTGRLRIASRSRAGLEGTTHLGLATQDAAPELPPRVRPKTSKASQRSGLHHRSHRSQRPQCTA